jgi:Domain of Unknown Function (DUF349)
MKLFARLIGKTPPSPPTLQERISILHAGSADRILDAALHADDESLRIAAIDKLPDGDALRRLAGLFATAEGSAIASPATLERAARARVAQLIDEGSIDFAALCDQARNHPTMFAVAALCKDAGRLPQALSLIDDPAQLSQLVVEGPASRLRQLAAERVHDPAQLRQLLQQVRNKDKSVYKILKQKCDALNAEDRKVQAIKNEIEALCASLERHGHRTYDSFYTAAFEHLKTRWHSLTTQPAADVEQRAKQAIGRCQETIEAHQRELDRQAAKDAAIQAARELQQREHEAAEAVAAARADAEARLREEAAEIREAEERERAETRAAQEQLFRQIGGLIRMASAALSDGGTQRAAGLRRAIEEKLPAAPVLPTFLSRQLLQLDEKLHELKQWKDYAVAPKRLELIAEMESLIGSTQGPRALADRIKHLQQEWRTIGKGIVSEAPEEWERFQQASQAAYQPCREHFEAQAKLRRENLDKRKAVLERLIAFEATQNGDNPDWRLLADVLNDAPKEWRRYFPVDREAGRAAQEEFEAAMGRLQAKLDAWHERNVADKQSLIRRARHLLTQEDSREAIDFVKRLQVLWKETGPAPGAQSQSLWNEFREICDSIYQKRQQAYAEYTSGLDANKLKAAALCEEAERVAALSGVPLLEGAAKIPEWRSAFDALDEMPRTEARGLHDRFERAIDLCKSRVAEQHVRDTDQSFTNLFEASRSVAAYEWAVLRGAESSDRETLKQSVESFIASVRQWPKEGLKAIKDSLAQAGSSADTDLGARERALRLLCVRGEIRREISTPAEDEALRREHQVQRLMQGMGQGVGADAGEWNAMALEWIRIGTVEPDLHDSLRARFMRCWEKRPMDSSAPETFLGDRADHRKSADGRSGKTRRHGRDGSNAESRR